MILAEEGGPLKICKNGDNSQVTLGLTRGKKWSERKDVVPYKRN